MCSTCKHLLEKDEVPVERIKPLRERRFFPKRSKKREDNNPKNTKKRGFL